jgi:hypothetical protein
MSTAFGYLVIAAELWPLMAYWLSRKADANRRRVAVLFAVLFGLDIASRAVLHIGFKTNVWFYYIVDPVTAAFLFRILYAWQTARQPRLAIIVIAPAYLLAVIGLVIFVEDANSFSLVTSPLTAGLLLALVLFTLVSRSLRATGSLLQSDWFWICGSLALYFACETGLTPALRYLVVDSTEWANHLNDVQNVTALISIIGIARGMLCPVETPSADVSRPGVSSGSGRQVAAGA